ncbi:MAG: CBS domain-containing protein [Candidatus Aenigmatarchaeota archaeon]
MAVLVKEVMSKPAVVVDANKTAKFAGELMRKNRRGFLVVVQKGNPIGALSDSDLIGRVVAKAKDASKLRVRDLMSKPMIAVTPVEDVMDAVKKMRKNNIHRLPVVDKGRLLGVVSLSDIARSSTDMAYILDYRQEMKKHPFEIRERVTSGICESCGNYSELLEQLPDGGWTCETCRDEKENEY